MKIIRLTVSEAASNRAVQTLFDDVQEELYGKLLDQPIAEIPDMDSHSLIQFHIHVPAARHLGTVISMLRKSRNRHDLAELAKIERL